MRFLGLDLGSHTIGIAISDPLGLTAQSLSTWQRNKGLSADLQEIRRLAESYTVERVVLGLPKNMNGTLGPAAQKVQEFAEILEKELDLEVVLWDERLSTVAAERALISGDVRRKKRKKVVNQLAAGIILQGYLDWYGRNKENELEN